VLVTAGNLDPAGALSATKIKAIGHGLIEGAYLGNKGGYRFSLFAKVGAEGILPIPIFCHGRHALRASLQWLGIFIKNLGISPRTSKVPGEAFLPLSLPMKGGKGSPWWMHLRLPRKGWAIEGGAGQTMDQDVDGCLIWPRQSLSGP